MDCIISDIGPNDGFVKVKNELIGQKVKLIKIIDSEPDFKSLVVKPYNEKVFEKYTTKDEVLFVEIKLDGPVDIFKIINKNGGGSGVVKRGLW